MTNPEETSENLRKQFTKVSLENIAAKMERSRKNASISDASIVRKLVPGTDTNQLSLYNQTSIPLPLNAYLACALTGLNDRQRDEIFQVSDLLSEICNEHGIALYEPRKSTDPLHHSQIDAFEVFKRDRERVLSSDLLILLSHFPSFGAGEELDFAFNALVPIITISQDDTRLSRMVTGIPGFQLHVKYRNNDELKQDFRDALINIRPFLEERKMAFADYDTNIVGERIRMARERLNLTREEVARKIPYLTTSALRHLEESTDKLSDPSLIQLRQVAAVLRTTVADLVEPDLEERLMALLQGWIGNQAAARFAISRRDRNRILEIVLLRAMESLIREE